MSIILYCGQPGSGKSLEAVAAILKALKSGRDVFTSVSGITTQTVDAYFSTQCVSAYGSLHKFLNDDALSDQFWTSLPDGCLLVIDESWSVFKSTQVPSKPVLEYLRMHRHYVSKATGFSSDVLLITQTPSDLHTSIRSVVESMFRFTKLKAVGLDSKYRVDIFAGARGRKADLISKRISSYDKSIFPVYSSYDVTGAIETKVDSRATIFGSPIIFVSLSAIFVFILCSFYFWRWLHSKNASVVSPSYPSVIKNDGASLSDSHPASERRFIGYLFRGHGSYDLYIFDHGNVSVVSGKMLTSDTFLTDRGDSLWYPIPFTSSEFRSSSSIFH